ncbi:exopolysaccharide biosynthesis protein [Echinicola sp. CAU 1574]|uniref:Exopolysaccharide biosynthesis protein n=1 Tax=Echinicola arenosa TaxID=2774144 RepID=A0ABR9AMR3_9BACT|nr:Wzz/FepE/Etk N-terminal domain-containing protein [Echinicola arenosa]MBD8490092.1 exopolysaccharide biosynthesis protein [Echinicola arenosa]
MNTTPNTTPNTDDEIDLLALAKTVWNQRKLVFRIVGLFVILGLLVAILSPKEFTASGTYLPQTTEGGKGGSLGGLASLAGINLGGAGGGSEIPPTLYPKIVGSVPFKKAMLKAPLEFEGINHEVTYQEYYEDYYSPGILGYIKQFTIGLPGLIIKALKGEQELKVSGNESEEIITINPKELGHFKRLGGQLSVSFYEEEGFVQLSAVMPDAKAAAQLTKYAEALLQKEVIDFKIKNAQEQLKFTEERYLEKKKEFEKVQSQLARYRDRNQNISSSVALNQLEKLEAEFNLAFSVYSELAKQLEQAKLQVSKDTPVFSVIEPITIPAEKSAPKRPLILVIFFILGIIIALGVVFGKEYLDSVKEEWKAV